MFDKGIRKVYTLAPDYAAGRQMIDAFTTAFNEAGGEIVGGDYTPFQKTQDFGPYLTKAKAANPQAIFIFYAGSEAISFVKQYGSLGMKTCPALRLGLSQFAALSHCGRRRGDGHDHIAALCPHPRHAGEQGLCRGLQGRDRPRSVRIWGAGL